MMKVLIIRFNFQFQAKKNSLKMISIFHNTQNLFQLNTDRNVLKIPKSNWLLTGSAFLSFHFIQFLGIHQKLDLLYERNL